MKEKSYQRLIEAIFSRHVSQSEKKINGKFADAVFIPKG